MVIALDACRVMTTYARNSIVVMIGREERSNGLFYGGNFNEVRYFLYDYAEGRSKKCVRDVTATVTEI